MPQDFQPKRRMLAAQLVTACEQMNELGTNFTTLKNALTQAEGGFKDEDFTSGLVVSGVNLSHLQSYEPNVWLNICVPSLITWLDTPIESGSAVTNRDILNAIVGKIQ